MIVLVLGANGATGFNVVTQLLKQNIYVKALARNDKKFDSIKNNKDIEIIKTSILDIDNNALKQHLNNVDAVVSCLGHNLSFKGIFGKPHTLVVDALKKTVKALSEVKKNKPAKVVLMNTTGCINKLQNEKLEGKEKFVIKLLRVLLPPQRDNELALEYLIDEIGTENKSIEWIAVRPDGLIDEDNVSEYTVHFSTVRSPIFNAGKTSRINVAAFMSSLLKDKKLWNEWKFRTPVIYNKE